MTSVTLRWKDPADAADFLQLRAEYLRDGYLMHPSTVALLELVGGSEVVTDGSEEGSDDDDR